MTCTIGGVFGGDLGVQALGGTGIYYKANEDPIRGGLGCCGLYIYFDCIGFSIRFYIATETETDTSTLEVPGA